MKKELKNYIHFYLGQPCVIADSTEHDLDFIRMVNETGLSVCTGTNHLGVPTWYKTKDCKPALRPLSDMTNEEADELAFLCMDSEYHLDKESRMSKDEMDSDLHKDDGGNMLDGDVELYIGVSARCFFGGIVIRKDGSITMYDETLEKEERIDNIADKIRYLLSCGFDLFNLIPEGLAIDKSNIQV